MKHFLAPLLALALWAAQAPAPASASGPRQQQQPAANQQPATQQQQQQPATQQPTPPAASDQDDDDDVVRISTNLVQFDAVAKDARGRMVTDLRPEDFEVFIGGKRQQITHFSFVSVGPEASAAPPPSPAPAVRGAPPVRSAVLKPTQVRRTVALVVDDLSTSWENVEFVRRALKRFVDEQMQPGDLVSIVRASAGMGALQQFTSDKRLLYRAIEGVRWNPRGGGLGSFAPFEDDPFSRPPSSTKPQGGEGEGGRQTNVNEKAMAEDVASRDRSAGELKELRERAFTVAALGTLSFLTRGMEKLPGRKSIVLFSQGFRMYDQKDPGKYLRVREELRHLVELANRSAVVIYPIDPRGVADLSLTAEDNTGGRSVQAIQGQLDARVGSYRESQDPLSYMARGTGGFFVQDSNDMGKGVQRVLDDQRGYYLIGFRPDGDIFEPERGRRRFNELRVKVRRPGVQVRARAGFLGITDEEARPASGSPTQRLVAALASPFASGDVPVRLTSLFVGDSAQNLSVNSLLHIDMSNVRFTQEADGWHKAVIDVFALTFGEGGTLVDMVNRTETVRARAEAFDDLRAAGLVYAMRVPVKDPGAYQLRVAVRDAADEKLGSASQYIEVPDLKKGRLALSGLVIQASGFGAGAEAEGQVSGSDPKDSPAVRRFRQGMEVSYYLNIYNARLDGATGRPQLRMSMRLFRDGRQVYAGPPVAFDPGRQTDMKNLQSGTRVRLDKGFVPGEYLLQVVVTDLLAPEKQSTATQWIDFEIVK